MSNLSTVASGLAATFAMIGANSSSSSSRWLNFGMSLASTAVAAWAGSSSSADVKAHANGGIFGKNGVVPLRAYQTGGIATSPQLALFGEGSMNEAYVPLPDGKTIPVTLSGDVGGGKVMAPVSISINVTKEGGSESSSGDEKGAWTGAAKQIKAIVLDTIAQEKRSGGSLNKYTARG